MGRELERGGSAMALELLPTSIVSPLSRLPQRLFREYGQPRPRSA